MNAMVGPAAYLVSPDDGRALGAALITVVMEGNVSTALVQAAQARRAGWAETKFRSRLWEAYQRLLERAPGWEINL
ncbi:MAG: hypothetical protein PHS96_00525 [Anaerolineales bacterium]|nr:hypothetical protein [Anaerolineales bacterium]